MSPQERSAFPPLPGTEAQVSMSLATIMLDQLSIARQVVEGGQEVLPRWRITSSEGNFLIVTQFDRDVPEQRQRALSLVRRFMVWKLATSYVLTAQTWQGPAGRRSDEALLVVGVSRHEQLAVIQRIQRGEVVGFDDPAWLSPHQVDREYFEMLPGGRTEISAEEAAELAGIFGKNGELRAERMS